MPCVCVPAGSSTRDNKYCRRDAEVLTVSLLNPVHTRNCLLFRMSSEPILGSRRGRPASASISTRARARAAYSYSVYTDSPIQNQNQIYYCVVPNH